MHIRAILSFLGRVNIANRQLVEHDYPDAQFLRIEASASNPQRNGTRQPNDIDRIRGIFQTQVNARPGVVTINEASWGEFAAPVYTAGTWSASDRPFEWDQYKNYWVEFNIAWQKVLMKTNNQGIRNVIIRWPKTGNATEPLYYFVMNDGTSVVTVGVLSGRTIVL